MIYKSKVITKEALMDILLWERLTASLYKFDDNNETIVSKVHSYIDDTSLHWVKPKVIDNKILVSVHVFDKNLNNDYFYMNEDEFNKLTDVSSASDLGENDIFTAMLEFYKTYGEGYVDVHHEDDRSYPLDVVDKHIKRHKDAKFRSTLDAEHLLYYLQDRWDIYFKDMEENLYASTASEDQERAFKRLFIEV